MDPQPTDQPQLAPAAEQLAAAATPNQDGPTPPPAQRRRGKPRPVLDEAKQQKVIALVAGGSSRRIAAHFVGCSPSTITRTAQRDAKFNEELRHAEHHLEVTLLRRLKKAAAQERYWRAGAWLLERTNPFDFAARDPMRAHMRYLIDGVVEIIHRQFPAKYTDRLYHYIGRLLQEAEPDDRFEAQMRSSATRHPNQLPDLRSELSP